MHWGASPQPGKPWWSGNYALLPWNGVGRELLNINLIGGQPCEDLDKCMSRACTGLVRLHHSAVAGLVQEKKKVWSGWGG